MDDIIVASVEFFVKSEVNLCGGRLAGWRRENLIPTFLSLERPHPAPAQSIPMYATSQLSAEGQLSAESFLCAKQAKLGKN